MYLNRKNLVSITLSETYLGENDGDCVFIHLSEYERITQRLVSDDVSLIFEMYDLKDSTINKIVRIGGFHLEDNRVVYAPEWIINTSGFGEKVTLKQVYDIPVATKLQIQLFDEENIYGPETKELFEKTLHKYGCVELNKAINLHLEELNISIIGIVTQLEPVDEKGRARFNGEVEVDIVPLEKELPRQEVVIPPLIEEPPQSNVVEEPPQPEIPVIPTREELRQMRLKRFQ